MRVLGDEKMAALLREQPVKKNWWVFEPDPCPTKGGVRGLFFFPHNP